MLKKTFIILTILLSLSVLNAKDTEEVKVNKIIKQQEPIKKTSKKEKNDDSEIVKDFIKVKDTIVKGVETSIGVLIIITLSIIKG